MRKLLLVALLLFPLAIHAQTSGTSQFPTSLDTSVTLPVAADAKVTFLTASATNAITTFTVNSTTGFPSSGVLLMPSGELVAYTGTSSTTFTGLTRGFSGTAAQAYSANQVIKLSLSAAYVNGPRGASVAIETKIGIDGSGGTATPTNVNDVLTVTASGASKWKPIPAGTGEANTASNVNVGGVGVFKQKSGVDLQFRGVNAGSSKVTITNDSANNEIDVDVVEANLTHDNIGGTLGVAHGGSGSTTAGGARANFGLVIGTDVEAHDTDLTTIAGLSPSNDDVMQRKAGGWTNRTLAQYKADLALNNVPNVDTTVASNITQDSTHRFATDTEKTTWNAKGEPNSISESVLGSPFTMSGTSGTFQDTGLSVTLGSSGDWKVESNVRIDVTMSSGTFWYGVAKLYNSTDAAYVADSETILWIDSRNVNIQLTTLLSKKVTVAASKTIKLYVALYFDGGFGTRTIDSDANGKSRLLATKIN